MSASLADRIHAFNPELPLERASTIPACWYRDHDIYHAEREAVFARTWLATGPLEWVRDPETFLTAEVAGQPFLVVRDQAGELRGFHNVCRHRAAALQSQPCGKASRLRCRYHGWTYDLQGNLRGVPEFDGVCDFRREDNGLVPLAVDTWGLYAWVNLAADRMPLRDYLGPIPHMFAGTNMEGLRFEERRSYELNCNWKVFVDNYLDGGYHVNTIHPGLAGVLDYSAYRTELTEHASVQISPMKAATSDEAQTVGQVREGDIAYYCHIFPNVMLNIYRGYADVNIVLPRGPERCEVIFDFFFAPSAAASRKHVEESLAVSDSIQQEDVEICEEVQRGLGSRAFDTGRYSVRREAAVHAFHRLLARQFRAIL